MNKIKKRLKKLKFISVQSKNNDCEVLCIEEEKKSKKVFKRLTIFVILGKKLKNLLKDLIRPIVLKVRKTILMIKYAIKKRMKIKIIKLKMKLYGKGYVEEIIEREQEVTIMKLINVKINKVIHSILTRIEHIYTPIKRKFMIQLDKFIETIKTLAIEYKHVATDKLVIKVGVLFILVLCLTARSYSWFYNEYISNGALFSIGTIDQEVKQYDSNGEYIQEVANPATIIYEANMGVTTQNTKYIEVRNTGTLDMEYNITFQLDGTVADAGVIYYRLYEVTSDVNASTTDAEHPTKLEAYAAANPVDANAEFDTVRPVSNLSTINSYVKKGGINVQNGTSDANPKYYRLDYGMYQSVNSSLYAGRSVAVHISVYSTQVGLLSNGTSSEIYVVSNETEFREALNSALSGDTIKLVSDITINGTIDIPKLINLDTNDNKLTITGDLTYDFVETGDMLIDVTGDGQIDVGGDFSILTPKTKVTIQGSANAKSYDIYVAGEFTISALQSGEEEGMLLQSVSMVKSTSNLIPVDIFVKSNTRLVIAADVTVGIIKSTENATNIEIINSGIATQIQLQDMNLLTTFTKAQIYIYNLGTIYGILGGASIIVPSTATPYVGPTEGNTLIIKGITSSDITVEGSDNFTQDDISYDSGNASVQPIANEDDSYIIYIKEQGETIEGLLRAYFTSKNFQDIDAKVAAIKKLVINTINGQYVNNVDFTFLNSTKIPSISYLSLENARVKDGSTLNKIEDNALSGKTSLKYVILPKTISVIGDNAFHGISLGAISGTDTFAFLIIPSSVTSIGTGAFDATKYVEFKKLTTPTIASGAFDDDADGTKFFVPAGGITSYQALSTINTTNVFQDAYLSDNQQYFVYDNEEGIAISYFVNETTEYTSLSVPNELTIDQYTLTVNAIGINAYRHIDLAAAGVTLTLPSSITEVGYGAFYDKNITSANFNYITEVGDYAFYNTTLTDITADELITIGAHAFESTMVQIVSLDSITTIGAYAFSASSELYEIHLGEVSSIGAYAFYDCPNVAKAYFNTTTTKLVNAAEQIDINIGTNALFGNWGSYINGRLRVYVPDGVSANSNTYLQLYKNLFSSNAQYIYLQGTEVGNYTYNGLPYQLSTYTIREVTKTTYSGGTVTGWEIISYQGADLSSGYQLPATITVGANTQDVISIGESAYANSIVASGQVVDLASTNLVYIGNYALNGLAIHSLTANNVVTIGEYGVANTTMKTASFNHLATLNTGALYNNTVLYNLNLGNASVFGNNSVSNTPDLALLYLTNDSSNTLLVGTPFANCGTNAGSRLRIYVPATDTSINYYKSILTTPNYVYATGYLVGSYTNASGNDIGQYTVRQVTKTNYSGGSVTGWELVEYHGANLTSSYALPTSVTANSTTQNVISIGREAYYNVTVATSNTLTLTNTNIINIGQYAFYYMNGLGTIDITSVTTIGTRAFMNTTLTVANFAHLNNAATESFANLETLYKIDLGTVKTMEANTLYNCDKLSLVYFTGTDLSLSFATGSINDIGSLTNNRLRFYVTDANAPGGTPFVDVYKNLFDSSYTKYFYRVGYLVGSYQQANIPYDIGIYSVRIVTLTNYLAANVTGWELTDYHGDNLTGAYSVPTSVTANSLTYNVISLGEYSYYNTTAVNGTTVNITNDNLLKVGTRAFYAFANLGSFNANYVTTLGDSVFQTSSLISGSFSRMTTVGTYAFASIPTLNMIHLGNITTFSTGLLYNDDSLMQIFMGSTAYGGTTMNFNIQTDAFTGVATSIGNRFRVYVPAGIASGSTTYVTYYKATLPSNIRDFVYATGSIAGTFTQAPEPYDIGQYMVREVTINGSFGWEIVDYHGANITSSYAIPSTITVGATTHNVVSVGDYAYYYTVKDSGQTWSVVLPDTAVYVGAYAYYATGINTVSGNAMYDIGTYAFSGCSSLTGVTFASVMTIKSYAFYLNNALTAVNVGTSTTSIGAYAFYNTNANNSLIEFRIDNSTPPSIQSTTFPSTSATKKIYFYVPYAAYNTYRNATTWTTWRNYIVRVNTPYLGVYNYSFIKGGTEIMITEYTGSATTVNIPDIFTLDGEDFNVTAIGPAAFDTAVNARTIQLPLYLNRVDNNMLGNSRRIRTLEVDANNTTFSATNGVLYNKDYTVLLKYPDQKTDWYFTVPSTVQLIASDAFIYNTSIYEIDIPSSVVAIAKGAFDGCTALRTYYFYGTTPPMLSSFVLMPYYSGMYIYVPTAALATYQSNYAFNYYYDNIYAN